jgi:hypothetical protein
LHAVYIGAMLPDLHQRWAEAALGAVPGPERKATCSDCAMCPKAGSLPVGARAFDPRVKCCTFVPELPNFLVGRIVRDDDPAMAAGRASVEARIAAGAGVTPTGLFPTAEDAARFAAAGDYQGRRVDLRCPHYVESTGACGIWKHRNGSCATWFCKHDRGARGQAVWLALQAVFRDAEAAVALWCVEQLGVDPAVTARLLQPADKRTSPSSPAEVPAFWGGWTGRERELYVRAAELADGLGWDDVMRMGGVSLQARVRIAKAAAAQLQAGLPERPRLARWSTLAQGEDAALVTTYSPHDPLVLPAALFSVLHFFDGRPAADAFAAMRDERGVLLDEELVRVMLDHGLIAG